MEDAWQHVALDQFRDGMPGRYRGINAPDGASGEQGLNVVPVQKRGERVTEIRFGSMGHRMLRGMHRAVAAFASAGNNVVVTTSCSNQECSTTTSMRYATTGCCSSVCVAR